MNVRFTGRGIDNMGDVLSFLSKLFDITARIAAAMSISGTAVIVLHHLGVHPVNELPPTWWLAIILLTIFGYAVIIYDALKWLAPVGFGIVEAIVDRWHRQKMGLKNYEARLPEHDQALRFFKQTGRQRFAISPVNMLIVAMNRDGLLDLDDRMPASGARRAYFKVPDHIWALITPGDGPVSPPAAIVLDNVEYWQ